MAEQRPELTPSDYRVFVVTLDGSPRTESVRAAYSAIRPNEWVEFKDHNHKSVRLYAPGVVRSIDLSKKPGDAFAFDAATPISQIVSDLLTVRSEDEIDALVAGLTHQVEYVRRARKGEAERMELARLHPDWSVEQVYEAANRLAE